MSKRFTDTELWEEDWFIGLPPAYQFFWIYLKDNCDHAGIWRPNLEKFSRLFGHSIQLLVALEKINKEKERIVLLNNGRLFLTGFIPFQYGHTLNLSSRLHLSVYQALVANGVKLTLIRPQIEVIDRVKEKDKDKEIIKNKIRRKENKDFEMFYLAYPKKQAKKKALEAFEKINPDEELLQTILRAIENQKRTEQWQKSKGEFIPMPATWLNQRRWEDVVSGVDSDRVKTPEEKALAEKRYQEMVDREIRKVEQKIRGNLI